MEPDLKDFLLSRALEGIIVTDRKGNILACNGTACEMLGYREIELLEQFAGFLFPARSVTYLLPNLLHLAGEPGGFKGDVILRDSSGNDVMVRIVAQAWPPPDPDCLLLRFLDWRETQQIITRMRESSQLAGLGVLTRSLSHEMLNPVTSIGGCTRKLVDSLLPGSEEAEWARQVLAGVERLESLIETTRNFLNLPRPSFSKGSVSDLLAEQLDRVREDAVKSGIRINRKAEGKIPEIYLDPELLGKAFSAVIVNALDRMPNGGDLTLGLQSSERHCQFTVADSGPAPDVRQMEEDLSPVHVIGSYKTHLNLAIARRIVDEHGGDFEAGASFENGLEVSIRLPVDRRALAREREM